MSLKKVEVKEVVGQLVNKPEGRVSTLASEIQKVLQAVRSNPAIDQESVDVDLKVEFGSTQLATSAGRAIIVLTYEDAKKPETAKK